MRRLLRRNGRVYYLIFSFGAFSQALSIMRIGFLCSRLSGDLLYFYESHPWLSPFGSCSTCSKTLQAFLVISEKKVGKETPPRHISFYFKRQNKSTFFIPDFCGCCGTHELNSEFAQTSSRKTPNKSLIHQLM